MSLEDRYEGLSDELRTKAKNCTTPDELMQLAKDEGIKLSDDELESIAGGSWISCSDMRDRCPKQSPGSS